MTNVHMLILIGLVLIPALGLALFVLGWRGRRVDDLPYCRRCRFSLAGLDTTSAEAKCPECGRSLAGRRAVGSGRRKKRLSLLIAGSFLLLAALAGGGVLGWGAATRFNWNTIKPVWWLEMDTGSTSGPAVAGAYGELTSRLNAGTLGDDDARQFVQRALAYQRSYARPWAVEIGDFIEAARLKQLVSMEDWVLYHRQGISLSGRLRTEIRRGAPLPYEFVARGPRMGSNGGLWLSIERQWVKREEPGELDSMAGSGFMRPAFGGGGSISGTFNVDLPVGRHGLILFADVALTEWTSGEPLNRWTVEYQSFVTVVDRDTVSDPPAGNEAVDAAVRNAISVQVPLVLGQSDDTASGSLFIKANNLPVDCSFEVLAVVNDREVRLGGIKLNRSAGDTSRGFPIAIRGLVGDAVTIILRTDHEAAERSVDLTEVWDGEIVLRDVPIVRPSGRAPARPQAPPP